MKYTQCTHVCSTNISAEGQTLMATNVMDPEVLKEIELLRYFKGLRKYLGTKIYGSC